MEAGLLVGRAQSTKIAFSSQSKLDLAMSVAVHMTFSSTNPIHIWAPKLGDEVALNFNEAERTCAQLQQLHGLDLERVRCWPIAWVPGDDTENGALLQYRVVVAVAASKATREAAEWDDSHGCSCGSASDNDVSTASMFHDEVVGSRTENTIISPNHLA